MFHAWFVRKSQSMIGGLTGQGDGCHDGSKGQKDRQSKDWGPQMDCEP